MYTAPLISANHMGGKIYGWKVAHPPYILLVYTMYCSSDAAQTEDKHTCKVCNGTVRTDTWHPRL